MENRNDKYEEILRKREIRPTAMRILILKTMMDSAEMVSILDLENTLETADKSTRFRTISLFMMHNLVHCIDDGSGSLKYAVCNTDCSCSVKELHAHFHCEKCDKTFCLKSTPVPVIALPDKFVLNNINYVLKGVCDKCSNKQ